MDHFKEAYHLWVQKFVYNVPNDSKCVSNECDRKMCSIIESHSRELCTLTDLMCVLYIGVVVTYIIFVVSAYVYIKYPLISLYHSLSSGPILNYTSFNQSMSNFYVKNASNQHDLIIQLCSSFIATAMLFYGMPKILKATKIDILNKIGVGNGNTTRGADDLLFEVWYSLKGFQIKEERYKYNLKPHQLYLTLAMKYNKEEVNGELVQVPDDLKEVMEKKGLLKKDIFNNA